MRRLVAEPGKPCFVCSRQTTVVLVSTTAAADDFFYVCASHLNDRNFATLLPSAQAGQSSEASASRLPEKVSKEEIEKVKKEYEERQKAKKDAAEAKKAADKANEDSKKANDDDKKSASQGWMSYLTSSLIDNSSSARSNSSSVPTTVSAAPNAQKPASGPKVHEYYSLHRSFYQMRLDAQRQKAALRRAKELGFPSVPKS